MKRFGLFAAAVLVFGLVGVTPSKADSIVNGSFENPNVGGGWSLFSNGSVPGWSTTDSAGLIEIDNSSVFGGGSSAYSGTQSLEVNANNPETVYQQVNGLTIGETYLLSWAYGNRPGSGNQAMYVYFGDAIDTGWVATDKANGVTSSLAWNYYSFLITADATTEYLSFEGLTGQGGLPSYGNEVDAVSLVTPEPSTWLLLLSGLGLLGFAVLRQQRSGLSFPSAI